MVACLILYFVAVVINMGLDGVTDIGAIWSVFVIVHCDLVFIRQPLPNKREHLIYAAYAIIGSCALARKGRLSSCHAA